MASVLITGTSKGIGFEAALAFGRAGHQVHATMRNPSQSPELTEIAAQEGLPITVSRMDVDSDHSVKDTIATILKEHGPVDVLINNAGLGATAGSVEELPLENFRALMETNYFGAIRCIQNLACGMRQRRSGCIINMSSASGLTAHAPFTAYNASKWALEALSEGLASEMKSFNVRVAIVEPFIINTAMARSMAHQPAHSAYPQAARFASFFSAALAQPVPPSLVAQRLVEVADSGTWQVRHRVGPGIDHYLEWRKLMSDEEWIDGIAGDDETWYRLIEQNFGMDTRPKY